jgi:hypothetical protein
VLAAAVSNDVASLSPLLVSVVDVGKLIFSAEELPDSLFLRPPKCTLLDAAASSGSIEVVKFLVLFHNAKVTRGTFCASLSSGDFELIRVVWDALADRAWGLGFGFWRLLPSTIEWNPPCDFSIGVHLAFEKAASASSFVTALRIRCLRFFRADIDLGQIVRAS